MKIEEFLVERWMDKYENDVEYNLGETCINSLSLDEIIKICELDKEEITKTLLEKRLSYGDIIGSKELREGISSLYETVKPEDILICHGAAGANNEVIMALVEPEDNTVCILPTYQQHYSIPKSIGAEVRTLFLEQKDAFEIHLKKLRKLVDKNTKLINLNNPNNPIGSVISKTTLLKIVEIAREVGAFILCDEVYRGIDNEIYSIVDFYEKGISTGSFSKIFSAAGLRQGWVATKDKSVIKKIEERRDYDTISCGVMNDYVATLIIKNKEKIFKRNREILSKNREILDNFIEQTKGDFFYHKPEAGTTALIFYMKNISSKEFCEKAIKEKKTLIVPGSCFLVENSFRVGYAYDSEKLKEGLKNIYQIYKEV